MTIQRPPPEQPPTEPTDPGGPRTHERDRQRLRRLEHDLADVQRARARINRAVWGIALGVMIYGALNVTALLVRHGVPQPAAPLLPLMVDLAMCAGLWGDRVMHHHGRRGGWVTGLRWSTATMTLALNVTQPLLDTDWVGLGIHACGPLLLLVVAEAAGSFQRHFTHIAADLHEQIDDLTANHADHADHESPTPPALPHETSAPITTPASGTPHGTPTTETPTTGTPTGTTTDLPPARQSDNGGAGPRGGHPPTETPTEKPTETVNAAGLGNHHQSPTRHRDDREEHDDRNGRDDRDPRGATTPKRDQAASRSKTPASSSQTGHNDRDRTRPAAAQPDQTRRTVMWHHFQHCRDRGLPVTGAELDRVAGTRNYGRAVIRSWVREGRITQTEALATRNGHRRPAVDEPRDAREASPALRPPQANRRPPPRGMLGSADHEMDNRCGSTDRRERIHPPNTSARSTRRP